MAPSTPIAGTATTYDLPNYTGVLYQLTPSDVPFFSAVGGLTGGKQTTALEFEWQGFDLRDAGQNVALEGAAAPEAQERVRTKFDNITQIHQETVSVTYTKQAAYGQKNGLNTTAANPITDELDWQTAQMLKQMIRDIEFSFIRGAYHKPVDNTTARKTRGLLEAIETNALVAPDADGAGTETAGVLTYDRLGDMLQSAYDNGGLMEGETRTLLVPSVQKRAVTKVLKKEGNYREQSRNIAGVNVTSVETDFGVLNIMLDRYMPSDTIAAVSLEQCAPVFLEIPGKGHFFAEPLAKTGSSDEVMLYGEVGLEYGDERQHAKLTNLTTDLSWYDNTPAGPGA